MLIYELLYCGDCIRNKLKDAADSIGLPTFTVADAGRTQVLFSSYLISSLNPGIALPAFLYLSKGTFQQFWPFMKVSAGSKTVLAIGPGLFLIQSFNTVITFFKFYLHLFSSAPFLIPTCSKNTTWQWKLVDLICPSLVYDHLSGHAFTNWLSASI